MITRTVPADPLLSEVYHIDIEPGCGVKDHVIHDEIGLSVHLFRVLIGVYKFIAIIYLVLLKSTILD